MASQKSPGKRTVVLVGRPNVGKSTLFNRITGTRRAIVAPIAGTTRDIIAGRRRMAGRAASPSSTPAACSARARIRCTSSSCSRAIARIASADLIVFVVDGRDGLVSGDEEIAATVRPSGRPVVLAVNKTDDRKAQARVVEFYALGFEPVIPIASEHGTGVGDLLDAVRQLAWRSAQVRGAGRAGRDQGRDHRPAQRRQVVAGQPAAQGRARWW